MKTFFRSLKRQDGFTLVELMVVVAIIGLLSAVAIPNFKKYQAKSKVSEAKLQLSALYTAQSAFFSDYNIYANCLRYMGYDPAKEVSARYYAVGMPTAQDLNATAHNTAVASGLNANATNGCPRNHSMATAGTAANTATVSATWYPAGKGVGAQIVNAFPTANPAVGSGVSCADTGATTGANISSMTHFGTCIGDQASSNPTNSTMTFQAFAVGYISGDYATLATASGLNINQNKQIKVATQGY